MSEREKPSMAEHPIMPFIRMRRDARLGGPVAERGLPGDRGVREADRAEDLGAALAVPFEVGDGVGHILGLEVAALGERKIIRPGYTTLQEIVSGALTAEHRRLGGLLDGLLDEPAQGGIGAVAGA